MIGLSDVVWPQKAQGPYMHGKYDALLQRSPIPWRGAEGDQDRLQDAEILARHASLTPREHEVFELVVAGLLNKLVAGRLGIAEPTVIGSRAHIRPWSYSAVCAIGGQSTLDCHLSRTSRFCGSSAMPREVAFPVQRPKESS